MERPQGLRTPSCTFRGLRSDSFPKAQPTARRFGASSPDTKGFPKVASNEMDPRSLSCSAFLVAQLGAKVGVLTEQPNPDHTERQHRSRDCAGNGAAYEDPDRQSGRSGSPFQSGDDATIGEKTRAIKLLEEMSSAHAGRDPQIPAGRPFPSMQNAFLMARNVRL